MRTSPWPTWTPADTSRRRVSSSSLCVCVCVCVRACVRACLRVRVLCVLHARKPAQCVCILRVFCLEVMLILFIQRVLLPFVCYQVCEVRFIAILLAGRLNNGGSAIIRCGVSDVFLHRASSHSCGSAHHENTRPGRGHHSHCGD